MYLPYAFLLPPWVNLSIDELDPRFLGDVGGEEAGDGPEEPLTYCARLAFGEVFNFLSGFARTSGRLFRRAKGGGFVRLRPLNVSF